MYDATLLLIRTGAERSLENIVSDVICELRQAR